MTIYVLAEKGQNHRQMARVLGVTEGTVRYHFKRQAEGAVDGRTERPYKAEAVAEYGYGGSYRSVLRYVREHYPKPKLRTYRRVGTPPLAQVQTDWAEYPGVDVGEGLEPLNVFWMVLSHNRMPGGGC